MTYSKEELEIFADGISLDLCALRSAQQWIYDEKKADEILWLEALYGKVKDDIKSKEQDG